MKKLLLSFTLYNDFIKVIININNFVYFSNLFYNRNYMNEAPKQPPSSWRDIVREIRDGFKKDIAAQIILWAFFFTFLFGILFFFFTF